MCDSMSLNLIRAIMPNLTEGLRPCFHAKRQAGFVQWAALAILLALVLPVVGFGALNVRDGWELRSFVFESVRRPEAEFHVAFRTKDVSIGNRSPNPYAERPRGEDIAHFVIVLSDRLVPAPLLSGKNDATLPNIGQNAWFSNGCDVSDHGRQKEFCVKGRSASLVGVINLGDKASPLNCYVGACNSYVGAQFFAPALYLYEKNAASEGTDDDGKERDDRPVVPVQPMPDATTVVTEREKEQGATFLWGLLGICVVFLANAILKRL